MAQKLRPAHGSLLEEGWKTDISSSHDQVATIDRVTDHVLERAHHDELPLPQGKARDTVKENVRALLELGGSRDKILEIFHRNPQLFKESAASYTIHEMADIFREYQLFPEKFFEIAGILDGFLSGFRSEQVQQVLMFLDSEVGLTRGLWLEEVVGRHPEILFCPLASLKENFDLLQTTIGGPETACASFGQPRLLTMPLDHLIKQNLECLGSTVGSNQSVAAIVMGCPHILLLAPRELEKNTSDLQQQYGRDQMKSMVEHSPASLLKTTALQQ